MRASLASRIRSLVAVGLLWAGCGSRPPPVAVAGPDRMVAVTQVVQLDGSGSHDGDPSSATAPPTAYAWSFVELPPGSQAQLNRADIVNPSFAADAVGVYVLQLVVTSAAGASAPSLVHITAVACAPKLDGLRASPPQPNAGDDVALAVDASEACDDRPPYRYAWSIRSLPPGSQAVLLPRDAMGDGSAAASPSFHADVAGDYVFDLRVTDDAARAADAPPLHVTVGRCGSEAPVIDSLAATPATPNAYDTVQLVARVSDADTEAGCGKTERYTYAWSLVAAPAGSQAKLNDAALADPSLVPDVDGTYGVTLVVTDMTGLASAPATLELVVAACGDKPPVVQRIDATPASPDANDTVQLSALVTDDDALPPCGKVEAFTYRWALVAAPAGSKASLNDATLANPSFVPDVDGSYGVSLVVTDDTGRSSALAAAHLTVAACGDQPPVVAQLAAAPASPIAGDLVALSAVVTDADSSPTCGKIERFSYAWTLLAAPVGSIAQLAGSDGATPSFVADVAGVYSVRLVVTDALGLPSQAATIDVVAAHCGDAPPVVDRLVATPPSPSTGELVTLAASVSDADTAPTCGRTESFGYAWQLLSAPSGSKAQLAAATTAQPTFAADVNGTYVVGLVVTDATGLRSAARSIAVTAAACGQHPPVIARVAASPSAPDTFDLVALSATVVDADALAPCALTPSATLAWRLVSAPQGSLVTLGAAATPTPYFTPDVPGRYTVGVVATDDTGRVSDEATAAIDVSVCGSFPPVVTAAYAQPAAPDVGQSIALAAVVTDADTRPETCNQKETFAYRWRLVAVPAGAKAQLAAALTAAPSLVADLPGPYQVELVVTDKSGIASAPLDLTFTAYACGQAPPVAAAGAIAPETVPPATVGPTQLAAAVGQSVTLDASASSDADASCGVVDALAYRWSLDGVPPGSASQLAGATTARPTFPVDKPGTYQLTLVVTDAHGHASAPAQVVVSAFSPTSLAVPGVGPASALVLDAAGDPRVAYYDPTFKSAVVATCDSTAGVDCHTAPKWSVTTIESPPAGADLGRQIALAVDGTAAPAGPLYATYWDAGQCQARFAVSTTSGRSWLASGLEAPGCAGGGRNGSYPTVAMVAGAPEVAFVARNPSTGGQEIHALRCVGGCQTAAPTWVSRVVYAPGAGGPDLGYLSVAIDPATGNPGYALRDDGPGGGRSDVRYVACKAGCATSTPTYGAAPTVAGDVFRFDSPPGGLSSMPADPDGTSLAYDSHGGAWLAFRDSGPTLSVLRCASPGPCDDATRWVGAGEGGGPTVDATGAVGEWSALVLDASDAPHVAYFDRAGLLRYAVLAAGAWQLTVLDGSGAVLGAPSLRLTSGGSPRVSYATSSGLAYYTAGP